MSVWLTEPPLAHCFSPQQPGKQILLNQHLKGVLRFLLLPVTIAILKHTLTTTVTRNDLMSLKMKTTNKMLQGLQISMYNSISRKEDKQ